MAGEGAFQRQRGRVFAWLELFRLPNVLTVPAEPLAGYWLAAQAGMIDWVLLAPVVGAAVCFYIAGLTWNDYFDRHTDRHDHPQRPLPSRRIVPYQALVSGWLLAALGLYLCYRAGPASLAIGLCLIGAIYCYDRYLKALPVIGVLNMGACRGLSLLLGASAVPVMQPFHGAVGLAALMVMVYISAVTQLARRESIPHNPGFEIWAPGIGLFLGLLFFAPRVQLWDPVTVTVWILALGFPLLFGMRMQGFTVSANLPKTLQKREAIVTELPKWIGWLIAHTLLLSLLFITSTTPDMTLAHPVVIGLVACWGLNRLLSLFFAPS